MKAIVQNRYGGAETLQFADVPPPDVGPGQVLVRVKAAGVDRGAYHLMRGLPYVVRLMGYGVRRPKTTVPGTNFAGEIEATGPTVTRFRVGEAVYGTCRGAFAEQVVVREDRIATTPASLTSEEAAVLPYSGAVSLQAVRDHARVRRGQSVLVVGASGAVGTIAVQLAKAFGAEVTGVCGTTSTDLVLELGADHVIDYSRQDFAASDHRYDVVLDVGGNTPLRRLRRALTERGTLVIIGGEGGGPIIGGIQRQLGAVVLSPFVRQKLGTLMASEDADLLRSLNDIVDARDIKPVMGRTFPLVDAAGAFTDLEAGLSRGRLVLVP